jgi:hypothetical protein
MRASTPGQYLVKFIPVTVWLRPLKILVILLSSFAILSTPIEAINHRNLNRALRRCSLDQSIFYVDIENLQDIAKQALSTAIGHWPEEFPNPMTIKLYVKADQTELWKIWTSHNIPDVEVIVNGVQHYAISGSKNSADIAIALDALADLLKSRTRHIAIMSDDSDYVSLFMALKQEIGVTENPKTLFKWFMTNRSGTRSQVLNDFFPSEYIYTVVCSSPFDIPSDRTQKEVSNIEPAKNLSPEEELIAVAIIRNIPVGTFKSADCKKVIKQNFPKHDFNKIDSAAYGTQFLKTIWPILEKYGVKSDKSSRGPRKYEMTQEAKNKSALS